MENVIMEKYSKIESLKDSLSKANFMILFLEQENQQLKVKKLLLENHEVYIGKEDIKRNVVMDIEDSEENAMKGVI